MTVVTLLALGLVILTQPTPLQTAILRHDLVAEEALLRHGADSNFAGRGEAPVILALKNGVNFVLPLLEVLVSSDGERCTVAPHVSIIERR